jgi:hypothetical protein
MKLIIGLIILICILCIISIFVLYKYKKINTIYDKKISVSIGMIIDKNNYYLLHRNNSQSIIDKYTRKGILLESVKLPFNITGGSMINNDIVLIDNRNSLIDNRNSLIDNRNSLIDNRNSLIDNRNSLIDNRNQFGNSKLVWIDTNNLSIIDTIDIPLSINWIDWYFDKWWVGCINKLYCFNSDWELEGYWKIKNNICGGKWYGQFLYMSCNKNYIYKFSLKNKKVVLIDTIYTCFNSKSFGFERTTNSIIGWGLLNNTRLVKCILNI